MKVKARKGKQCSLCGDFFFEDEKIINSDGYCKVCQEFLDIDEQQEKAQENIEFYGWKKKEELA